MRRSSTLVSLAVTAALLAVVIALHPAEQLSGIRRAIGLGPQRPLPAPAVVSSGGTYTWAMTQPGSDDRVGWDPCEEIRYQVNPDREPSGGRALITAALRRASAATGLAFDAEPMRARSPTGSRCSGDPIRW